MQAKGLKRSLAKSRAAWVSNTLNTPFRHHPQCPTFLIQTLSEGNLYINYALKEHLRARGPSNTICSSIPGRTTLITSSPYHCQLRAC